MRFEVQSDQGVTIQYDVEPWKAGHGVCMLRKLLPLLEPIMSEAGFVANTLKDSTLMGMSLGELGNDATPKADLLDGFADFATKSGQSLAKIVLGLVSIIAKEGDDQLFLEIFDGAMRRTKGGDDGRVLGFSSEATIRAFDSSFKRNYGELLMVTAKILVFNFGPMIRLGNQNGDDPGKASPTMKPTSARERQKRS